MSIPSSTNSENSGSPLPEQAQAHAATTVQSQQQQQSAPVKRSSRRANTAERRATHNAVERARRETLNSRFLDLAAMLPNLAAVRRPSKSAIVNSSIALIHNQSRARIIGARELRLLNAETNALRTELNEWRLRNQLPRVEEPVRSTDFATLLAVEDVEMGEEMILGAGRRSFDDGFGGEDDEEGDDYDQGEISPEGAVGYGGLAVRTAPMQYPSQQQQLIAAQQQQQQQQQQQLFEQQKAAMARAHAVQQAQIAQQQQQQQQQARYTPPQHHQHSQSQPAMMFPADLYSSEVYQAQAQQSWSSKAINALTPPGSAHGHVMPTVTKTSPTAYTSTANSAFLGSVQQQQHGGMFKHSPSSNYSDDQSDGSSHFSENNAGLDQPFSFGLSSNTGMGMNMNLGGFGLGATGMMGYGLGMMQMPPSPPHTGSPGSNIQSRRQSIAVPTGGAGSNKSSPGHSPTPMSAQAYGMGLMI